MKKTLITPLFLICLCALALRLGALVVVDYPGIADPTHYYNLALRLLHGHGFTIDYIWQYNLPPAAITHPEEHWMPLTAVIAAGSMALFGETARAALLPFAILGALLPVIGYLAARQLNLSRGASLFSAAALAVLPEYLLYSTRTDTLIPSALCMGAAVLCLTAGLRRTGAGAWAALVGCGVLGGLGYLTRSDGGLLLPMLVVVVIAYRLFARPALSVPVLLRAVVLVTIPFALVVAPWIARNLSAIGMAGSPETADMFFFTDNLDHFAFGRTFTLQTMLANATPAQLIGKRLFEFAAAVKVMITTLDVVLPVAVAGGLILVIGARDRLKLLSLAPVLILLLGILVAYPILIPYKSQAGSFKKAALSILPLLIPLGAYAFERAISEPRVRAGAMALTLALATVNGIDALRLEQALVGRYRGSIEAMVATAQTLPDRTGDGVIILMTQDPFIIRYAGLQSVMYPFEPIETVIAVARRYGVDYLLFPADRYPFEALQADPTADSRFFAAGAVPDTDFSFFAIVDEDAP